MREEIHKISELILIFPINNESTINLEYIIWNNFINTEEWLRPINDENVIASNRSGIEYI